MRTAAVAITAGLLSLPLAGPASGSARTTDHNPSGPKPTVVLVHGAGADGSSWAAVTAELRRPDPRTMSA